MKLISYALRLLDEISVPGTVSAHCDIPCGVYEPDTIRHAAETVFKMSEKISQVQVSLPDPTIEQRKQLIHDVSRMTEIKEKYAQICKDQLLILWTDYFKDEHLKAYPDLHTTFWKAAKLCSTAKRTTDIKAAQDLKDAVGKIAEMFVASKQAK